MDDGKTPASPTASSKAEPRPAPTDAELSRMAREAVHQAPDPHLDRHLQRMGLVDAPEAPEPAKTPSTDLGQPVAEPVESSGVTVELLDRRLRRAELSIGVLGVAVVVLALIEVVQLIR
jgi:hypothetical protein